MGIAGLAASLLIAPAAYGQAKVTIKSGVNNIGLGRVVVGETSKRRDVEFLLDSVGKAQISYRNFSFAGAARSDFSASPYLRGGATVTESASARITFHCTPRQLGARSAMFAPTIVGAAADQNTLPLRVHCIGVGKTRNITANPVYIYNGSMSRDGSLDFGGIPVGTKVKRIVTLINQSSETRTMRAMWAMGPVGERTGYTNATAFALTNNPAKYANGVVVKPGQKIEITVTFQPTEADTFQGTLEVRSDVGTTANAPDFVYTHITGFAD